MLIDQKILRNLDSKDICLYKLSNKNGLVVKISNYGATVTTILTPDQSNKLRDIVLGFDDIDQYLEGHPYFGSTIGRFANRIAGGCFSLHGNTYKLDRNKGVNHLHGGSKGFDKILWNNSIVDNRIIISHLSTDGDQGYPGNLNVM